MKVAISPIGIYHDKIGLFKDKAGNEVIFHGSTNESKSAYDPRRSKEGISVWTSWHNTGGTHFSDHKEDIVNLWDETPVGETLIMAFPDVIRVAMLDYSSKSNSGFLNINYEKVFNIYSINFFNTISSKSRM